MADLELVYSEYGASDPTVQRYVFRIHLYRTDFGRLVFVETFSREKVQIKNTIWLIGGLTRQAVNAVAEMAVK